VRRLVGLLIGLAFLLVPGQALAALAMTNPAPSTTIRSNQSLTVSWNADGDASANNVHPSYLLFTGAFWTVQINLNRNAVIAHTLVFKPNDTATAFRGVNTNATSVVITPAQSSLMLPADTYAVELFILNSVGGIAARAGTVQLAIEDQCDVGTYSSDGWPPCTLATAGHYVSTSGSTSQFDCAPGTFAGTLASRVCYDVPPGTYASGPAATVPTDCGVGSYQDVPGQTLCKGAPSGSFVAVIGAVSATPCPPGTTSPAGSISVAACVGSETSQRIDAVSAAPTATTTVCVVALGTIVRSACVAGQLGISIAKPTSAHLVLARGKQSVCVIRSGRIRGTKVGSCRVVLVVIKPGSRPKTYRATVTIGA